MINIRKSVFETNSSSSHSISISEDNDGIYDTIIPDEKGVITLTGGEYGWSWESFFDAVSKANYAATYTESRPNERQMLNDLLKEHTGAKNIKYAKDLGYIDHQSVDTLSSAFASKEDLKNWLFSPKSYLYTGNDNDSPPSYYFYDPPDQKYEYTLSVEGCRGSVMLKTYPANRSDLANPIKHVMDLSSLIDDGLGKKSKWEFSKWDFHTIDGVTHNSFEKLNLGIDKIILYKTKPVYEKNNKSNKLYNGDYLGERILDVKEISFTIEKITNEKT